jgi:hypothetical protein
LSLLLTIPRIRLSGAGAFISSTSTRTSFHPSSSVAINSLNPRGSNYHYNVHKVLFGTASNNNNNGEDSNSNSSMSDEVEAAKAAAAAYKSSDVDGECVFFFSFLGIHSLSTLRGHCFCYCSK